MKRISMTMTVLLAIGVGLAGFYSARTFLSPWRSIAGSGALAVVVGESCSVSMKVAEQLLSEPEADPSCQVVVVPFAVSSSEMHDKACRRAVEVSAAGAALAVPDGLACRWLAADGLAKYQADDHVVLPVWYRGGEVLDRETQKELTKAVLAGQSPCSLATHGSTPAR